jgi:hypothetical protein
MRVHRKLPLIALSILLVAPIGPRVLLEYVAKIVAIRTSDPFRARLSTFVHPATKNKLCYIPNT